MLIANRVMGFASKLFDWRVSSGQPRRQTCCVTTETPLPAFASLPLVALRGCHSAATTMPLQGSPGSCQDATEYLSLLYHFFPCSRAGFRCRFNRPRGDDILFSRPQTEAVHSGTCRYAHASLLPDPTPTVCVTFHPIRARAHPLSRRRAHWSRPR